MRGTADMTESGKIKGVSMSWLPFPNAYEKSNRFSTFCVDRGDFSGRVEV